MKNYCHQQALIISILKTEIIYSRQQLISCLEDMIINQLEVDVDPTNKEYLEDLRRICAEIIKEYQTIKATDKVALSFYLNTSLVLKWSIETRI